MIAKLSGVVWKKLPARARRMLVRATQAKFTVSAAVVVVNRENKVLLLDHILRKHSGWGLPGGFIDSGEQPEDGVRRELCEETGIDLKEVRLLGIRTINTHLEVLFTASTDQTPSVKSDEIRDLGWFFGDSLPAGLPPGQKTLIKKVLGKEV